MSRYLILVLLNLPLIMAGILYSTVSYKMGRTSRRRYLVRLTLWLGILTGLIFAQPIYVFLFKHDLTQTEPLSLFDVIQITGIITTFFIANRAYIKQENLERRLQQLHRELSIRLSNQPTADEDRLKRP